MKKYILIGLLIIIIIVIWFYIHVPRSSDGQMQIVKFSPSAYSDSDDLIEEYHLWLKISPPKTQAKLLLNGFGSKASDAIMTESINKSMLLMPYPEIINQEKHSNHLIYSFPSWFASEIYHGQRPESDIEDAFTYIHLYSGFKLKDKQYRLSLTTIFLNDKGEAIKEHNLTPFAY